MLSDTSTTPGDEDRADPVPPLRKARRYGRCTVCGRACYHRGRRHCRSCYLARLGPSPLRTWRAESGHSYEWLAAEAGVSVRAIHELAAGRTRPCADVALALHAVTGISLAVLLRGR